MIGNMESESKTKPRQGIQSIEAGTRLLKTLAASHRAMMLKDLAKGAGMAPAKAHRYLVSYIRCGLIAQNLGTGRYDLGPFALELGLSSLARLDLVRLADPVIEQLCDDIDETVALTVWGNFGPTVIRMVEPATPITVSLRPGAVLPLATSATGRAFVAFNRAPAVRRQFESELKLLAKERNLSLPQLHEEIDPILSEIRSQKLSRASGSLTPGINGFSAPVFDYTGAMIASLTTLGAVGHFDDAWISPLADRVRQAASELSKQLGAMASAEAAGR
ncbi:MAG TPA: IclR family transcriptional regulator [Rhodocyclaceae bacterium]|nr:IclR family transcriptional regulator [Rhodocyclaceae bacterium]